MGAAASDHPLTWEPLLALPGLVALESLQPWNDTTIEARLPWRLRFPTQQWAYGAGLPVHCPPTWPSGQRALVKIELEVERGRIGVAGVDAALAQQTTAEQQVAVGVEQVELVLDPQTTPWLVLRTTSEGGEAPEVILTSVDSLCAASTPDQAASRRATRHGLSRCPRATA